MPITINGSGSITGLSVGGLPDGTVDTDTLASSARNKILQFVAGTIGNTNLIQRMLIIILVLI